MSGSGVFGGVCVWGVCGFGACVGLGVGIWGSGIWGDQLRVGADSVREFRECVCELCRCVTCGVLAVLVVMVFWGQKGLLLSGSRRSRE